MSENEKNTNTPFLSVKDLVVEYKSDDQIVHAVNKVSLHIEKGKTLGLVGETGAGKTTIAKSILRILPDVGSKIVGGEIYLEGENLLELPENEMRKIRGNKVSMIFQDPMTALNPVQRVGDQIAEVVRLHNEEHVDCEKRAKEMLEIVGIPGERYYEYPHQFSGGMKQRVVIAIALACNPDLLLADEPTTALDVTIQAQILDLLRNLKDKINSSIMLITHDLGVVAEMADYVVVMYAGRVVEKGTAREIFKDPRHPYTIGLMNSKPVVGKHVDRLYSIPGSVPNPVNMPDYCYFKDRCEMCVDGCEGAYPEQYYVSPTHMVSCYRCKEGGTKHV
jgi:peptide/nickel transport system ATP-binding protein